MNQRYCKKIGKLFVLLTILVLIFNGCKSMSLPNYKAEPIEKYPNSKSINDLTIAIKVLKDKEESEKYFGVDFNKTDLIAVLVLVANNNSDDSFIIEKEKIILTDDKNIQKGEKDYSGAAAKVKKDGEKLGAWSLVLISPILGLAADTMVCNSREINRNLLENEFQTNTISKGKSYKGFVYFKFPQKTAMKDKSLYLKIKAYNLNTKTYEIFAYEILI